MTNQQTGCASSEASDQPGHPLSLIRVFAVRMKKAWVLSYPLGVQRRLRSACASAQAALSLRWGCPGWSESSLSANSFCWVCHVAAQISMFKANVRTRRCWDTIGKLWAFLHQNFSDSFYAIHSNKHHRTCARKLKKRKKKTAAGADILDVPKELVVGLFVIVIDKQTKSFYSKLWSHFKALVITIQSSGHNSKFWSFVNI